MENKPDKSILLKQIKHLINQHHLNIETINTKIILQKITHQEWSKIYQEEDDIWDCLITLDHSFYKKLELSLAELFAALFMQFGQSDGYDEYKCSFSYSFNMTIEKNDVTNDFLLNIYDWKGGMPSYKFYGKKPKDEVLMQQDLKYAMMEFLTFLIKTFREQHADFNQNFYRVNQSGFLIYGFENSQFFNNQHDSFEKYSYELFQDAIQKMKNLRKFETPMSQ